MIACYDLERCPPTYDAVAFLALAELERVRRGDDHVEILVLPGPASGFRADGLGTWPHTTEERVAVRDRVLLPLCRLLPSARSVRLAENRSEGKGLWGYDEKLVGLPSILAALGAGCRPLRRVGDWSRHDTGKKMVTLTLREAEHHPLRNSRTDEWSLAVEELADLGLDVVILRDARLAQTPLVGPRRAGVVQAGDISDLVARAALYSLADLNAGVSNGPMWMSIFMDAPTLMLRPTTDAAGACYDAAFFARCGVPGGGQLPESPGYQRLVWEEDTVENIVRAVAGMIGDLAEAGRWS